MSYCFVHMKNLPACLGPSDSSVPISSVCIISLETVAALVKYVLVEIVTIVCLGCTIYTLKWFQYSGKYVLWNASLPSSPVLIREAFFLAS